MDKRVKDLSGLRFGSLTVSHYIGPHKRGALWALTCECGGTKQMPSGDIKHAIERHPGASCGCKGVGRPPTHGLLKHPLYRVHQGMLSRCNKPSHKSYKDYGGRGIKVCERWRSFPAFFEDMAASYSPGLTIERKDNNGDYSPSNCRWATEAEQHSNTRANVFIQTPKGRFTLAQTARAYGMQYEVLLWRLKNRWSLDRALGISSTT
jgi:hypothetical protein